MIHANELRIGNYVYFENPHSDYVKIKISSSDFKNFERNICFPNFEPIPLTEEILLKCGFEKILGQPRIQITNNNSATWSNNILDLGDYLEIQCYYLHQLQNLYFALTNNELKIKI